MIVGLGVDVVDVARVEALLVRHGERFLARCFADREVLRPGDAGHLAGLVAAKEATFKALGTGWDRGVGWRQVVVRRSEAGAPELELGDAARRRATALGVSRALVSISHDAGVAVAVVVLEA